MRVFFSSWFRPITRIDGPLLSGADGSIRQRRPLAVGQLRASIVSRLRPPRRRTGSSRPGRPVRVDIDDALMFTTPARTGQSVRECVAGVVARAHETTARTPGPATATCRDSLIAARTAMAESESRAGWRGDGFVVVHLYPFTRRTTSADDVLWNAIASRTGGTTRSVRRQRTSRSGA